MMKLIAPQSDEALAPPMVLLEHQPLAAYCNNILSALNELRLCAPLSLACDVADQLRDSLESSARIILDYHRWVSQNASVLPNRSYFPACFEMFT